MVCQKCCQNFKEATCVFANRRGLSYFLLNVILNLKKMGINYVIAEGQQSVAFAKWKKYFLTTNTIYIKIY